MAWVPDREPVTTSLIAMLADVTERPCHDLNAPAGVGDAETDYPYTVVETIAGGRFDGDIGAPSSMITWIYQVTAVGLIRAQVENLEGRARHAILDRAAGGYANPIVAAGVHVIGRGLDSDFGVSNEGPLVNSAVRYELTVTPTW